MSTIATQPVRFRKLSAESVPPLESGDHLDRQTFHARYEAMPKNVRAELIGGIVYMPSALKLPHIDVDLLLGSYLTEYMDATPGTRATRAASILLGDDSEPQPDLGLLIDPARGGQTRVENEYVVGAPELVIEIA